MPSPVPSPESTPPKNVEPLIRFGRYQLDVSSGELRKEGRKIRLQPQPIQLLALLARNAGRVVSREEIRRELWAEDTFVDFDQGLASAVNKVREALCDAADNPRLIETLHKRGYRFIGKVETDTPENIFAPPDGMQKRYGITPVPDQNSAEELSAVQERRRMFAVAI